MGLFAVETIAGVCADHFSQVFDTETLITFIRQAALSLEITEFERSLLEPKHLYALVQTVDLALLDPFLLLVLEKTRLLTQDLTPEVQKYLWHQTPFHPQLLAKTGYGDVGAYDMLESPFLMYRFSDGVKLAEDLIQDLVSKHYTKYEVGDVVGKHGDHYAYRSHVVALPVRSHLSGHLGNAGRV